MKNMLKYLVCVLLMSPSLILLGQDQKPSKEEIMQSILDPNVSEEEAIEILAKYYPELLEPVVAAKKDFEKANTVQNSDEAGQYYQELGQRFLGNKDYDQAIIYFQKSILEKKNALGGSEKHPDISISYQGLGQAHEGKKDIQEALRSYQRGLISNAVDFDDTDLLNNPKPTSLISNAIAIPILEAKGNLLMQSENDENQLLAALIAFEQGIEVLDLACKKFTSETARLNLSIQANHLSEQAIKTALKLYKITRDINYKNKLFTIAEKGKAMILTSVILESKAALLSKAPPNLFAREQQLKTSIAQLNQTIKTQKDRGQSIEKEDSQLFTLRQALFFLQDSLKTYYPKHEYLKYNPPSVAIDSLQMFLAENDAALVEYFIGTKNAFAFTLTGHDLHVEKLEGIETLANQIIELREDIQAQNFKQNAAQSYAKFVKSSRLIYNYTLAPSLEHISPNIRQLIIIPDGALWLIPFEMLLHEDAPSDEINFSSDHLPYLINKYAINYAHNSRLLISDNDIRPKSEIDFAGFAPSFSGGELAARSCFSEQASLAQLEFNQKELEEVATFFSGTPRYGNQATKSAFLNQASNAEILHLSTHACLNKDDPMDSRIFFADHQYLSTENIYAMRLNAKLTVLSACQTGLGKVYNGEGVISLANAFARAGCSGITMSLWPVADEATATIMVDYYKNLDEGINKSEALRQAKLKYLNEQPKAKQHPFYWAAFVHLGDDSPIKDARSNSMFFWLSILGAIVLFGFFLLKRR